MSPISRSASSPETEASTTSRVRISKNPSRRKWPWVVAAAIALPVAAVLAGYATQLGKSGPYTGPDGAFTHITPESSFAHVANHPAFEGYGDFMVPWESGLTATITKPLAIEKLAPYLGAWDPQTMADGINFLIDEVNAGQTIFHSIYNPSEIAADPSKSTAGIFVIPGEPDKPLAFVAAGGGFTSVASIQEAFPHAKALHERGYNVVVLKYRVGEHEGDNDVWDRVNRANEDMSRALTTIRNNSEQWHISLEGYSVWGSSAGGRLVSSWGSEGPLGAKAHGFEPPTAIVAAYPGISFDYSETFPPFFVTAAADDDIISIPKLDAIVADMRRLGVTVEYDKVETGGHGYGLGIGTAANGWFQKALDFWEHHRQND